MSDSYRRRSQWLPRTVLALALYGASFISFSSPSLAFWEVFKTQAADYADALADKLHDFDGQAAAALDAYDDASIARHLAEQVDFSITDEETTRFLARWEDAASEAAALVDNYDDVIRETKLFFVYLKKQAADIKDQKLRESVNREISGREAEFGEVLRKATSGMNGLQEAIEAGTDVVRAIKIQAALVVIEEKVDKASAPSQRSVVQAAALRAIAHDGLRILDGIKSGQGKLSQQF